MIPAHNTADYVAAIEPTGDLALGLADMAILDALTPDVLASACPTIGRAALVFADCNLPAAMLADLIARRRADRLPWLAIDAVSAPKVMRLPTDLIGLDLLFLNEDETAALLGRQRPPVVAATALQAHGAKAVVLTCGLSGVIVADAGGAFALPALPVTTVANVTGAGDALVTADLHRLAGGDALLPAAKAGLVAAALALERQGGVRPDLSPVLLESAMHWAPSLPQDTR